MNNATYDNFTDIGGSTVNICPGQRTTEGTTSRARSVKTFFQGLTWRHWIAACFCLAVIIVVIAVPVSFANRRSKTGDTCLPSSPRAKSGFLQDPDYAVFIVLFWPWSNDMNNASSKVYEDTISKAEYWVNKIFESSLYSSCIKCFAANMIKLGGNTLLLSHLHDTCQVMTAENVKKAFDEGYTFLYGTQDKSCVVNISKHIQVREFFEITEPDMPAPSQIRETICGQSQLYLAPRIVGGDPTLPGQYPWIVMLLIDQESMCGGTIWDYSHILTAAHCIQDLPRDNVTGLVETWSVEVWAGKWFRRESLPFEQYVRASSGRIHTGYEKQSKKNDIAVLKLAQSLQPTQLVMKVCHPNANTRIPEKGIVAGWGDLEEGLSIGSPLLMSVELNLLDFQSCSTIASFPFNGVNQLPNGTICAIGDELEGKDSCQGDSGGPLFSDLGTDEIDQNTIIGVVSYGDGCGKGASPGVYASVPFYLDWINEAINLLP